MRLWFDEDRRLHREDGPAVESPLGSKAWYRHGVEHREDGPAVEYHFGTMHWYLDGAKVRTERRV